MVFMEQASTKGTTLDADHRLDILRLIRAAKGLAGEADYYEYADAAQRRGLPWEVVSLVDEGRALGKITKPNPRIDPIYSQAVNRQKAEVSLASEEKRAAAGANGAVAMSTADAYLASGNNAKAIELYRLALQKGGVDTSLVNTRLGIALARSGQKAEAKAAFSGVSGSPRGDIARFWTTWLDQQP
jgi:Flp pilus assembly protein TadD